MDYFEESKKNLKILLFLHLILIMVKNLIIVWVLGVVSFFVLWALLTKITQCISKKKNKTKE